MESSFSFGILHSLIITRRSLVSRDDNTDQQSQHTQNTWHNLPWFHTPTPQPRVCVCVSHMLTCWKYIEWLNNSHLTDWTCNPSLLLHWLVTVSLALVPREASSCLPRVISIARVERLRNSRLRLGFGVFLSVWIATENPLSPEAEEWPKWQT